MAWYSSHIKGKTRARTSLELRARVYGRIAKYFPDKEFTARELKEFCPDVVWSRVWGSLLDLYEVKRLDRHWHRFKKDGLAHRCYKWTLMRNSVGSDEITGYQIGDFARERLSLVKDFVRDEPFDVEIAATVSPFSRQRVINDLIKGVEIGELERLERGKYRFL